MLFDRKLMLARWVLVIAGAVWLVVPLAHGSQGSSVTSASGQTPLTILQARDAKSEITREQYNQMSRDLGA